MTSPAVQIVGDGGIGTGHLGFGPGSGTVAYPATQTAGNTNVVAIWMQNSQSIGVVTSVTDSAGNTYSPVPGFQSAVGGSGGASLWLFTRVGIAHYDPAAHGGVGNTVTVAWSAGAFADAMLVEYPPTGAVRGSNGNNRSGGGTVPISTTLSGTAAGELVVFLGWSGNVGVMDPGTVGANAANVVATNTDGWVIQDGLSDGSSPCTTVCGINADDFWTTVALSFLPSGGPTTISNWIGGDQTPVFI